MKKIKVFLVSMLSVLTMLVCFVGCGPMGTYKATAFDPIALEAIDIESEETASYIKFESGKKVVISINVDLPLVDPIEIKGNGTWAETETKDKYEVTLENDAKFYFTKVDGDIHLDVGFGVLILEKD